MKKLMVLLPALIAALIFALTLTACSPPPAKGPDSGAQVAPELALAYSGAVSALVLLDELHGQRVAAIAKATPEQFALIKATTDRLKRARDGLALVRDWIEGQSEEKQAALSDAFEALKLVLAELRAGGVKVPEDVDTGLAVAAAFLGVNPG